MPTLSPPHCNLCNAPCCTSEGQPPQLTFCCHGCETVYRVLEARGELSFAHRSPLFKAALSSGLIANQAIAALASQRKEPADHSNTASEERHLRFEIEDLWCPSCAEVISLILLQKQGVVYASVDYATDQAIAIYDPLKISSERLFAAISALGYRPHLAKRERSGQWNSLSVRTAVAFFCAFNAMMGAYPLYAALGETLSPASQAVAQGMTYLSSFMALPALTWCAWPLYRRAYNGLHVGILGMELLVTISVIGTTALSLLALSKGSFAIYFDSATAIIAATLAGRLFERRAKHHAAEGLQTLLRAIPKRCRRLQGDTSEIVPIENIALGDQLRLFSGETIPLDGRLLSNQGYLDEALLTGEPLPRHKRPGDPIVAGSRLLGDPITMEVTTLPDDSTLQTIVHSAATSLSRLSSERSWADRIASHFVIGAFFLATSAALIALATHGTASEAILRALSVLLISCPCALAVAVPLVESELTQLFAKKGVLVRNRQALALLGKEHLLVFDKTGTVTEGRCSVVEALFPDNDELWQALYALAQASRHPLAESIVSAYREKPGIAPDWNYEELNEIIGSGIVGKHLGKEYRLGSQRWFSSLSITSEEFSQYKGTPTQEMNGNTHLYFAAGTQCVGRFTLQDQIRNGFRELIPSLRPLQTVLLSGDEEAPTAAVAAACGFTAYKSCCSPFEKQAYIAALHDQGKVVTMIGDGVNDALSLATADVGISLFSASEVAIHSSGLLLTVDRPELIGELRQIAQRAHKLIRQNLFWASIYNAIGMIWAATGGLHPLGAAIAMTFSSLLVVANSQRLASSN